MQPGGKGSKSKNKQTKKKKKKKKSTASQAKLLSSVTNLGNKWLGGKHDDADACIQGLGEVLACKILLFLPHVCHDSLLCLLNEVGVDLRLLCPAFTHSQTEASKEEEGKEGRAEAVDEAVDEEAGGGGGGSA